MKIQCDFLRALGDADNAVLNYSKVKMIISEIYFVNKILLKRLFEGTIQKACRWNKLGDRANNKETANGNDETTNNKNIQTSYIAKDRVPKMDELAE